jgi:hypothetical protein
MITKEEPASTSTAEFTRDEQVLNRRGIPTATSFL